MSEEDKTDYAKAQEEKHKRKIILPCVIPWEYGSNKYASQKGSGGFGGSRDATLKIFSTTPFTKNDESVVPRLAKGAPEGASQAGLASFGKMRDQITRVMDKDADETIDINCLVPDKHKKSERMLKKWDQPNPEAKNNELFGKRRNVVSETSGGRRFTQEELQKSRAAIPRFQDPRGTLAALNSKPGDALVAGLQKNRQATTEINGLDRSEQDQLDSNRYMAWLGGQLTLQSQSMTGGFQKPRDVVSTSYYDKLMADRDRDPRALRLKHRRRKTDQKKEQENENTFVENNEDKKKQHEQDEEEEERVEEEEE